MRRDVIIYLKDILEAINAIENFVNDIDFEKFKKEEIKNK